SERPAAELQRRSRLRPLHRRPDRGGPAHHRAEDPEALHGRTGAHEVRFGDVSDTDAPWVLLRGLGREAAHWGDFPERLKAALPGATVLTPDLPGCGADLAERPAATVAGLLDRMRRCLAAPGPVHLLG